MKEKIFHTRFKVFGRSDSHKAVQKAAYRSGEKLHDERYGRTYNYINKGKKEGIESTIYLPEGASEKFLDREYLYNKIESCETRTKTGQLMKEIEFSLYTEFTPEENKELVEKAAKRLTDKGMIADCCIHKLQGDNPHCHMMLTLRDIKDGDSFGNKNREWDDYHKRTLSKEFRAHWEELVNEKFKEKGLNLFVSKESFKKRGIDRIPTQHLPADKTSEKYQKVKKKNKEIRKRNNHRQEKKEAKRDYQVQKEVRSIVLETELVYQADMVGREVKITMEQTNKKKQLEPIEYSDDNSYYNESRTSEKKPPKRDNQKQYTTGEMYKDGIEEHKKDFNKRREDLKQNKEKIKSARQLYKDTKEKHKRNITYKKEDRDMLKNDIGMLKARLKGTSVLSISDWKERRQLKSQIAQKKVLVKKKNIEIKREKSKIKQAKKEYTKHLKDKVKLYANKTKDYMKMLKTQLEMEKVKDLKQEMDNVVSLKEFKKEKQQVEMKKPKDLQMEKQRKEEQKKQKTSDRSL
ncbi:MobA/MobL family protein [Bacillus sp. BML-BC060]|uniref:MobA/MobL family protein n=1 Tax=Bacillus sp. BML-BC060 TaxID=2842487 RepID=UPI001C81A0B8|nr:MobA/MobL family protein [Bacillus sp. BML-BC060]